MMQSGVPESESSKRGSIPFWVAALIALLVYELGPWALSLMTPRHGWAAGRPGAWNLLELVLVVAGTVFMLWTISMHFARPEGVRMQRAQNYLLSHGPYAYSRHPMYLSELAILLGWTFVYGSVAVLFAFLVAVSVFNLVNVPCEERALEARFGELYRQYKIQVPRWGGIRRRVSRMR
jgi:protein-S-isoprenylcysteine O-methyltransferase Ste14